MKTSIITVSLVTILLFSSLQKAFAEVGIQFETATWSEVLAKAKSTNKPIFIDVYTSWCGPCKLMAKTVFLQQDVASKFNADFINYKIDAEKGEGIELAKKYKVTAYPTYLFVNGDGMLVYRSSGSMPAEKFTAEANMALGEFKDPKPLAIWEDEYEASKQDKAFVWNYLQKRKKLRLNNADLLDQYATLCTNEELLGSDLIAELGQFMNLNIDGPFYGFLRSNSDTIKKVLKEKYKKNFFYDQYLVFVAKADVDRAIANRDEELLAKINTTLLSLPPDENPTAWRTGETSMKFYTQTNNPEALLKVVNNYGVSVIKYDTRKILTQDSLALDQFDKDVASGKITNIKPESMALTRKSKGNALSTQYAYRVRDICKSVYNIVDEKKSLKQATEWIEVAGKYSNNFTIPEVKAGLIYKQGKKAEGIEYQKKTIAIFDEIMAGIGVANDKIRKRLEDTLQKMNAGQPTWGLENYGQQTKVNASDLKRNTSN